MKTTNRLSALVLWLVILASPVLSHGQDETLPPFPDVPQGSPPDSAGSPDADSNGSAREVDGESLLGEPDLTMNGEDGIVGPTEDQGPDGHSTENAIPTPAAVPIDEIPGGETEEVEETHAPDEAPLLTGIRQTGDTLFEPVPFDPVRPPILRSAFGAGSSLVSGPAPLPVSRSWQRPRAAGRRAADRPIRIGGAIVRSSLTLSGGYTGESDGTGERFSLFLFPQVDLLFGRVETARYLTLRYGAGLRLADTSDDDHEVFDQNLSITGEYRYDAKLSFGAILDFASLSGPERETGERSRRNLFNFSLAARYAWTEKTSVVLSGSLPVRQYEDGIGSDSFSVGGSLLHQYSKKTTLGLGLSFGAVSVEESSEDEGGVQTYEELTFQFNHSPSKKLSFAGRLGLQARQYDSGDGDIVPVFDVRAQLQVTGTTALFASAYQAFGNSAFSAGQNIETTSLTAGLLQTLGNRTSVTLSCGIEWSRYRSVSEEVDSSRRDTFSFVELHLAHQLSDRLFLSGFASYSRNDSNENDYERPVCGLSVSLIF